MNAQADHGLYWKNKVNEPPFFFLNNDKIEKISSRALPITVRWQYIGNSQNFSTLA